MNALDADRVGQTAVRALPPLAAISREKLAASSWRDDAET
jgi:hypothetical protein